jgi:hypothetical protein
MEDLLYGCASEKDEILKIISDAVITDASDEFRAGRIKVSTLISRDEYFRIIFLNGYGQASLNLTLFLSDENNYLDFTERIAEWKKDYPEFFKEIL